MADSVQSRVIDAAVAALSTTLFSAYRCRMAAFKPDQLPAFNVLPEDAEPDYDNAITGFVNFRFKFRVRMMAATKDQVDKAVDALYVAGSKALLADPTLGGLVLITRWAGEKWEREGQGEYDQIAKVVTFESEFSTSRNDPSVAGL
jgi:hypothetical protein